MKSKPSERSRDLLDGPLFFANCNITPDDLEFCHYLLQFNGNTASDELIYCFTHNGKRDWYTLFHRTSADKKFDYVKRDVLNDLPPPYFNKIIKLNTKINSKPQFYFLTEDIGKISKFFIIEQNRVKRQLNALIKNPKCDVRVPKELGSYNQNTKSLDNTSVEWGKNDLTIGSVALGQIFRAGLESRSVYEYLTQCPQCSTFFLAKRKGEVYCEKKCSYMFNNRGPRKTKRNKKYETRAAERDEGKNL